jgi:hypothetical protein
MWSIYLAGTKGDWSRTRKITEAKAREIQARYAAGVRANQSKKGKPCPIASADGLSPAHWNKIGQGKQWKV